MPKITGSFHKILQNMIKQKRRELGIEDKGHSSYIENILTMGAVASDIAKLSDFTSRVHWKIESMHWMILIFE